MKLYTTTLKSPVGPLRLYANDGALTAIYLENHKRAPVLVASEGEEHSVLREARRQLEEYFAGERGSFELPLEPIGTPFQQMVWKALREIPLGVTWTYAGLARHIGREGASRAVGSANARNPLSIVVPCHRVVGTSGALTGYAGGVPTKQWLLEHEQRLRGGSSRGTRPRSPFNRTHRVNRHGGGTNDDVYSSLTQTSAAHIRSPGNWLACLTQAAN